MAEIGLNTIKKTEIPKNFCDKRYEKIFFYWIKFKTKPPTDFFAQNPLQFGRRARRSGRGKFDNSSLVLKINQFKLSLSSYQI